MGLPSAVLALEAQAPAAQALEGELETGVVEQISS